jgi:hypothetical protein
VRNLNKSTISVVVVALIIGVALGSVAFPRTSTLTSTEVTALYTTQTTTLTIISNNLTYPIVTATRITILVIPVMATCTTISGTMSVVYTYGIGQMTTETTVYPPNLPQEYWVTVVTASTFSASNQTFVQQPDTC